MITDRRLISTVTEIATPVQRFTAIILATLIAGCNLVPPAFGQQTAIGIAAPLTGSFARLGEQMQAGAEKAITNAGALPVTVDDNCSAEGGKDAAEKLIAAKVTIATGFLCIEAIEAALPLLTNAGIPVITPGVRAGSLTDRRSKTGWLVFRTAPRADAEREAVSAILTRAWADKLFAIVDDGTIYGRELAESFRLAVENAGLEPVFTDTYRPQFDNQIGLANRLKRAGATHVLAGGNLDDIAILGRDAAKIDYPLTIAGGEALRDEPGDVTLAPGTLMIGLPEPKDAATASFFQMVEETGITAGRHMLDGFVAAEIALGAVKLHQQTETALIDLLSSETFATAGGEVSFDAKGDRTGNPYRLFRYDGETFTAIR